MSENDPYGSEGGARNDRPYPYSCIAAPRLNPGQPSYVITLSEAMAFV